MGKPKCVVSGCANAAHAKGLCSKHLQRLRRHGATDVETSRGRPKKMTPGVAVAEFMPDAAQLSPRTRSRIANAIDALSDQDVPRDIFDAILRNAVTNSGRLNVAALSGEAETLADWLEKKGPKGREDVLAKVRNALGLSHGAGRG
jgi:hypothetical protein